MVLVDMDMPKNCMKCPLHDGENGGCQGNPNIGSGEGIYDRPRQCPIKEDIKALMDDAYSRGYFDGYEEV